MNILYIYAHPNPHSFNHALKDYGLQKLAALNVALQLSDLYAENFNPVASFNDFNLSKDVMPAQYFMAQYQAYQSNELAKDIDEQLEKIAWCDHIILQFPLWWFGMPAILKGWFDRTMVKGFAYDSGKIFANGLLSGKGASLVTTTQSPEKAYDASGVHGHNIQDFLLPIHHTLRFAGITPSNPFVVFDAMNMDATREQKIKQDYDNYLQTLVAKR